jgi:hypothetical protein
MSDTIEAKMQAQSKEFDAVCDLAAAYRLIEMTAVVDDDYPHVRHRYESALRALLAACKANGRMPEATAPRAVCPVCENKVDACPDSYSGGNVGAPCPFRGKVRT